MTKFILLFLFLGVTCFAEHRKVIIVVDSGVYEDQITKPYMCNLDHLSTIKGTPAIVRHPFWFFLFNEDSKIITTHGENIINIIGSKIDYTKYCVRSIRYIARNRRSEYIQAIKLVSDMENVVAVNLSLSGDEFDEEELKLMKKLIKKKIKIISAIGNDNLVFSKEQSCLAYPACLKAKFKNNDNFVVVMSTDTQSTNMSTFFEVKSRPGYKQGVPKMSGTSQATANYTGDLFSKTQTKETYNVQSK